MSAVAVRPVDVAQSRVRALHLVIGMYAVAAVYHALNSFWHLTPAIFIDELLYSKLAQSVAAGDGLTVRGEGVFFPGLLPVLLQAPAWLIPDMSTAYAVAKLVNALVMTAAVFPAYWLARQLVDTRRAVAAAAFVAVSPALLYHDYLMSEALAYPVFLTTVATMTRALGRPSRRWELGVVGMCGVAALTRVQFVALPIAYVVAAVVTRRVRAHRISVGAIAGAGLLGVVTGGVALGPYIGAALLDYGAGDLARWGGLSALLIPFGWGWFLAPGALLGLWALRKTGFGVLAATVGLISLAEITLVAGGQAERPLERYAVYLAPLAFTAFLFYAGSGAPWRRVYIGLSVAFGLGVWLVPFPTLAPGLKGYSFSFDSPTLSAYGSTAVWLGHPNAATIFCGLGFAGCVAGALLAWRRRPQELLVVPALVVLAAMTVAAYAGDRAMTSGTRNAWAPQHLDWLDRSGLGTVDYLELPGASPHFAYVAEAWNRNFGKTLLYGVTDPDPFADERVKVDRDGRLLLDGLPSAARTVAISDFGSRLVLDGEVVARPGTGFTVYRLGASPRVRSLAVGLFADGWARTDLRYQVWPAGHPAAGRYEVRLELPRGFRERTVTLKVDGGGFRVVHLVPGDSVRVSVPVHGWPVRVLRIETSRLDYLGAYTPNPRLVGVRVPEIAYVPSPQGRA